MKKDRHITEVIFRKFKEGEVIALFPYEIYSRSGYSITSYMHVGQHGSADGLCLVDRTKLATEEEYSPLLKELNSIGYNLKIVKRRNHNKYLKALKKARQ